MPPASAVLQSHIFDSPSPLLLPEMLNLASTDSISHLPTSPKPVSCPTGFTPLPTRPSVLTNRMSPYNTVLRNNEPLQSKRLLTKLPSVKNNERGSRKASSSGSTTPDLSRSNSTSTNTTPVMSPESVPDSMLSHSDMSCYKLGRKHSMESLSSSDNSSQYSCLSKDDQYLLHLKDVEGLSCWSEIAERMHEKGFQVQQRKLRTRYCILKRDLDLSLQRQMENLSNIQSEVDEILGSTNCPVRRLASTRNKKIGGNLRVYDEEEEPVDPHVWEELAASLQASGLRYR